MSIFVHKDCICPECGQPATMIHDTSLCDGTEHIIAWECCNARCENSPDNPEMALKRFLIALDHHDFAKGDSFWIGDIEFEVKNVALSIL